MLFRSEEGVNDWCARRGMPRGETLPLSRVWELAQAWYQDRLDPGFRGRSLEDASAIFRELGLTSPFWSVRRAE